MRHCQADSVPSSCWFGVLTRDVVSLFPYLPQLPDPLCVTVRMVPHPCFLLFPKKLHEQDGKSKIALGVVTFASVVSSEKLLVAA